MTEEHEKELEVLRNMKEEDIDTDDIPKADFVSDHVTQPKGTADKILDFFLRRKRVLAKYTKEEKQKAIDL